MKETKEYLIPDYYTEFRCKMGDCRAACCQGWPVSVSMSNYYRLLGISCRKELRDRLDCALQMVDHPTNEEYARFNPRWDGNCPMRMENGLCSLHAELGEEHLPDVCRLYPRGIRADADREASCSCSCERVLELLIHHPEPLTFSRRIMTVEVPEPWKRYTFFETLGKEQKIRLMLIRAVQDRALSLPDRLMRLGEILRLLDTALKVKDVSSVDSLIAGEYPDIPCFDRMAETDALAYGLDIAEKLLSRLDERSNSIRECGIAALNYFLDGDSMTNYLTAKDHFESEFPEWESFFENVLVNHMFFYRFPFQDRPDSMHWEFTALCAVYALMRFLGLGWMADKEREEDFIDVCAAAFRLIDHADFDRYSARELVNLGCTTQKKLYAFIKL